MSHLREIGKAAAFKVWLVVTVAFFAILIVANLVVTQNLFLYNTVNSVFGGERTVLVKGDPAKYQYYEADYKDKAETLKAANALNERIAEEGIVMLKNEGSLPLKNGAAVSVFGKNSVSLVYGGTGSGGSSSSGAATIYDSLAAAHFTVNPALKSFYENNGASGRGRGTSPSMGAKVAGFAIGETPQSMYTQSVKDSYGQYGDAALIVISRIGGEGFDLPRTMKASFDAAAAKVDGARNADDHYLQLDQNETDLIKAVGQSFDNVIIIINCSTPMELGFLNDPGHYAYSGSIKGALWIGNPGKTGINALGRILSGEVTPSGRTVDTYARDFRNDPSWQNFSNNNITNGNRYTVNGTNKAYYFVDYEEGIYVGYRYWETRGADEAAAGNADWYGENVVFPLGYGLSYTDFEWETVNEGTTAGGQDLQKDGVITVKIRVTNTGSYAGKDVVQLYSSAPYYGTKENPGIEKSSVVMQDFVKTKLLSPGESDTVTLELKVSDLASYDYSDANSNGFKGYEAEAGAYVLHVSRNAHEHVIDLNYSIAQGFKYAEDTSGGKAAVNRFDDVSGKITQYLSRADWEGTMPVAPSASDREVSDAFISSLTYKTDDAGKKWESETAPVQSGKALSFGAAQVKLYELREKPYNDPLWEKLLDQLTVSQMSQLIGTGNYNTMALHSIGKPKTIDPDGPVGFTAYLGDPSVYDTCFYASGCVVAATYNAGLAYEMGKMVGNEGIIGNEKGDGKPYSGWYAPAVNIHRSPFGGRNWEYYSEDGILSGKIAGGIIQGAKAKGVYTYIKHFALNEQETNRTDGGLLTWANEQSMRELYFKPFETAVRAGETTAIMSSFNRIGTVWAGGSYELLTEVLRNEWGFKGMVVTDYNLYAHMPADQMIRAGGDLNLCQDKQPSKDMSATQLTAMRNATHNILYTVVKSNAMNGYGAGVEYRDAMPDWVLWMIVADLALAAGFGVWGFFAVRRSRKKQKEQHA